MTRPPRTPVLVINANMAADRLAFQRVQAERLGLPLTRVPAIAPAALPEETAEALLARGVRPFARTEISCLLSHAACWRRVVASGVPHLVLEDDAVLSPLLPAVLDAIAAAHPDRTVNFETYMGRPKYLARRPVPPSVPGVALHRVIKGSAGAAAYLIGPRSAEGLLAALRHRAALADIFIGLYSPRKVLQTVPALGAQMMTLESMGERAPAAAARSTIAAGAAERAPGGPSAYMRAPARALRRLTLEMRVAREKIEGRLMGERRVVPLGPGLAARDE